MFIYAFNLYLYLFILYFMYTLYICCLRNYSYEILVWTTMMLGKWCSFFDSVCVYQFYRICIIWPTYTNKKYNNRIDGSSIKNGLYCMYSYVYICMLTHRWSFDPSNMFRFRMALESKFNDTNNNKYAK